jgi:CRP/FNR family transcriptional regulator, nitrogen oxide reductase regulator
MALLDRRSPSLLTSLRVAPVFSGVGDARIEELARTARRRVIGRGESFFRSGGAPELVVVVTRGLVKMVRPTPEGDVILGVFGPRDTIGLIAVLHRCTYPADAVALTDEAEAICISASHLMEAMAQDPTLAVSAGRSLAYHACVLQLKIDVITAGHVPQRIAALLVNLAERFGDELEDGTTLLPIVLSRTELSRLVGARVETTIRVLSSWQKRGLVTTSEDGFVLRDPRALAATVMGVTPGAEMDVTQAA